MKRIETPFALHSRFTPGDGAHPKTPMTARWLNGVQEELCHVIEREGIPIDPTHENQLLIALLRKKDRPRLYKSWEIPSRFTGVIPFERIDRTTAVHERSSLEDLRGAQPQPASLPGEKLEGFKFDPAQVISASFMVLIEREIEDQAFYRLSPVSVQYGGSDSLVSEGLGELYWRSQSVNSLYTYRLRSKPGSPLNFNLYASLVIDRDGQMYLVGKNTEGAHSRGRLSIYDLKTVKPIP